MFDIVYGLFEFTYELAKVTQAFFLSGSIATVSVLLFALLGLVGVWLSYTTRKEQPPLNFLQVLFSVCVVPVCSIILGFVFEVVVVFGVIWFLPIEVPIAVVVITAYLIYYNQPALQNVRDAEERRSTRQAVQETPPPHGSGSG